jgi:hypothetical protein
VRLVKVTPQGAIVQVPAFGHRRRDRVLIPRVDLPDEIWQTCVDGPTVENPGPYFHAKVNLGAERPGDLRFSDWELR